MGEYAEMMLDGTCCEGCGEYLGNGDGFPRYCSPECEPKDIRSQQSRQKPSPRPYDCRHCGRIALTGHGVFSHVREKHPDVFEAVMNLMATAREKAGEGS